LNRGARHGLKLSGKLARIMEQEQQALNVKTVSVEIVDDTVEIVKKKKRKNKHELDSSLPVIEPSNETDENPPVKKKKKNKDDVTS
jgi:hypothetical protein